MKKIVHITNQFKREVKVLHIYIQIKNAKMNFKIYTKQVIIHRVIINCIQHGLTYISMGMDYLHYYSFT